MIKEKTLYGRLNGIGGDDRCGVFAIIKIIERGFKPYILFTTDEEKGCLGAKAFTEQYQFDLKKKIRYIIEIDRRGEKQAVFYRCANKEFQDYVLSFGFTKEFGSCSDISTLSPKYDIASVNLSAGYYNEHTKQEHVKVNHLMETIKLVKLMLSDKKNDKFYDFQEQKYTYEYSQNYNSNKKDNKKNNKKNTVYEDEEWYWDMWTDYPILTNEEFKKAYGVDKPATRERVWYL